ncbi:MAG: YfiR family protein [Gammaproteobacteria bacterium]|nr:YfiR family protein [Gammaproteobacteria bacterium]
MKASLFSLLLWLCTVLCVLWPTTGEAGRPAASAQKKKAAIIYNLSKFIRWPNRAFANNPKSFRICMLGNDPLKKALAAIANKRIRGRKVVFKQIASLGKSKGCHVLYISTSQKSRLPEILAALRKRPVLSISSLRRFAHQGGIAGLIPTKKRVRFAINLDAAKQAGLSVSTPLLEMATVVRAK